MSKKPKDRDLNKYVTAEKPDNASENLNIGSHNGSPPATAGMNGDLDEAPPLYICHTEEEPSVPPVDKNKKRINHNATEKNRKDKIRKWINKIGDLLPPVGAATEKPLGRSTLEIVESAWEYITQLKSTNDRLLVEKGDRVHLEEIERLKMDISNMKMERDRYLDMLKSAGNNSVAPSSWSHKNVAVVEPNVEEVVQNGGTVPVLTDSTSDKEQDLKNKKTKRRNTISLRLENMKKQQQQLQEGQLNVNQELSAPGMMGNFGGLPMNNVIIGPNGQQIIGNPNMLMNQMMLGGNQMFGQNAAGMISLPNVVSNQVIGQNQIPPNADKNAEVAGAGLLQLAMQDAGITPNSNNSNNSSNNNSSGSGANQNSGSQSADDASVSAAGTVVSSDASLQSPKSGDQIVSHPPSALQTLASVASNTQNISSTSTVSTASTNNNLLSQNSSAATATTQAINTNPIMATGQNGMQFPGGNGMMNMQFQINGQQCFTGNVLQPGAPALAAPQGQIMFINEQGVPCIANVPLGMDPSMGLQKQILNNNMLPGQQLPKDLQGNSAMADQALIANTLAQQQMNMTLQGQLTGMNQQNFQQQQQNAVAMGTGNLMQQAMNNPLAAVGQQFIQPMQGQMQGSTMTQQGIIMPASQVNQSGNLLTVNSVPNQNSQLPQALLLPNGQIIPVVSNPQVFGNSSQTGTVPQQVLQQTGGSVQWQQNPGGAARMALPGGIQGKVISQGPEATSTGNNTIQGQVITSNGQLQIGQPHLALPTQVAQQNQQVALQTGLLMTTNSSLQTSSTTTTSATESQPNIVSSTQSVVISQPDDSVTSASSLSNQFMDSSSANIFQNGQNITSQGQGQMVTSQGQGFMSMEGLEANVQSANLNNPMMMPPVFNGPNNTSVNVSSQDNSLTSSVLPSMNTQLTSAINSQIPPGNNPGGAIVLQISCNGQPTSILVDPNTLQVLGTVQTQQQSQPQAQAPQPTVQTTAPPPGSQTQQSSGKKKGKGSQRAIYPKPSSNANASNVNSATVSAALPATQHTGSLWLSTDDASEQMDIATQQQPPPPPTPVQNKKSTKSKPKNKNTKAVSDTAAAESQDSSQGSTDILAKAAESIFSTLSPPVGGFYNPANEDNPLQIDTSAGETEEDPEMSTSGSASPRKESHLHPTSEGQKKIQKEIIQSNKPEQKQNQNDPNKMVTPVPMETVVSTETLAADTDSVIDILTSSTKSMEKQIISGQMSELADNTLEITTFGGQKKSSAKSKKLQDSSVEKEILDTSDTPTNKKTHKKSNKKQKSESTAVDIEPVQTKVISPPLAPVQEEEQTMEIMPETITFTEENLCDVLDQVESLGNSLNDSTESIPAPVITPPPKKSKSRKSKSTASSENEPASKKSKKSNAKDKSGKAKESVPLLESLKPTNTAKSSLSVYDFDEDGPDDVQTPMMSLHNSRTSAAQNSSVPPVSSSMSMDTPLFGDFPSFTSNKKETPKSKSKSSSKSSDKKRSGSGNKSSQELDNVTKESGTVSINSDKTSSSKKSPHELFKSHTSKQAEETSVLQAPPSKQTTSDFGSQQRGNSRNKYDGDKINSGNFNLTNQNSSSGHREISALNQISPSSRSHDVVSSNQSISTSVLEPVHISTTSDKDDIDNTVNTILGLSATSLSPHIISPRQNQPDLSNNTSYQKQVQRSPVLRTPTSVSPVSMTSVSMAHSPPMSQGLQTPKCTSPVPVTTSQSVTKSLPISSVTASDTFNSNTTFSSGSYSASTEISYSAESLFSSSTSDKPVRPDTLSRNEKMNDRLQTSSKSRSSIYSADNFVQSSKNDSSKFDKGNAQATIASPLSAGFARLQNDNSSDSFNFSNIGLNVTTPTTSASSIIDSLSMSPVIATLSNNTSSTSSFTFTLSSVTSTVATTSATIPSHQSIHPFPFYQHLHSPQQQVASSSSSASLVSNNHISASQSEQPMNMSNFDVDLSRGPQITQQQSQNPQHSGHDRMPPSHVTSIFSYGMQDSQNNCSLREPPHEQPPFFPNITVTTPSSVNKSQSDQMRNTHKQTRNMQELNMGRNMSNKPHIVEPPISSAADRNLQIPHSSEHQNNVGIDRSMQLPPNSESRSGGSRLDQPLQLSRSSESRTNNVIECPVQMSGNADNRNSSGHDRPMQLTSNTEKRNTSGHERTNQIQHKPEQRPGSGHMDRTNQVPSSESRTNSSMDRPIQHGHNSDTRSSSGGLDRQSQLSNSSENRTDSRMPPDRHPHMNSLQSFFPGSNFPNTSSHSLNTPPLHHLPLLSQQEERSNMNRGGSYESVFPHHAQGFNAVSQNFHGNRYEHGNVPFQQREMPGSHRLSHTPPNSEGRKSANPPSHSTKSNKQSRQQPQVQPQQQQPPPMNVPPPSRSTGPTPPHQPPLQRSTPPQATPPQQNPSSQQSRQSKSSASRSKQSQKKNKPQYLEMDTSYPAAMFDTNRSLTPFFGLPPQNLSPPSRNIQNEGPLFPGNFFGASSRPLSNSSSVPKNAEISTPFNSLFPPSRPPQNGLGLNFQHGFGMNHGGMSSGTQITPHSNSVTVTPHMSNFSLTNIFSDVGNSQNDSMNMSPIKFPHSNPILPPQGMDPNSLQHPHHQSSSLYHHNRGPHPPPPVIHTAMSINSILGHNHHGFDTRPMPRAMNTSAPPFGGHGHPPPTFGMPPLDFSMHEH